MEQHSMLKVITTGLFLEMKLIKVGCNICIINIFASMTLIDKLGAGSQLSVLMMRRK